MLGTAVDPLANWIRRWDTSSKLTETLSKHIEHSELCVEAVSSSVFCFRSARIRSCVVLLLIRSALQFEIPSGISVALELVQSLLPTPVGLNPDLHTAKDLFLSTSEVDSELHNVSIIDRPRP